MATKISPNMVSSTMQLATPNTPVGGRYRRPTGPYRGGPGGSLTIEEDTIGKNKPKPKRKMPSAKPSRTPKMPTKTDGTRTRQK